MTFKVNDGDDTIGNLQTIMTLKSSELTSGAAQSNSSTTEIKLASGSNGTDDYYKDYLSLKNYNIGKNYLSIKVAERLLNDCLSYEKKVVDEGNKIIDQVKKTFDNLK